MNQNQAAVPPEALDIVRQASAVHQGTIERLHRQNAQHLLRRSGDTVKDLTTALAVKAFANGGAPDIALVQQVAAILSSEKTKAELHSILCRALNTLEDPPEWAHDLCDRLYMHVNPAPVVMTQHKALMQRTASIRYAMPSIGLVRGEHMDIVHVRSYRLQVEGCPDSDLIHEYSCRPRVDAPNKPKVCILTSHQLFGFQE